MGTKRTTKAVAAKAVTKVTNPLLATSVIRLTKLGASGNPKRPNTAAYKLYSYYRNGITVGAYVNAVKAGGVRPNAGRVAIAWDLARGFITVS